MFHLLLAVIYLSFISLGLPDSLLGSAWPSMYGGFGVPVSYASIIFMIISAGTIVSSLQSDRNGQGDGPERGGDCGGPVWFFIQQLFLDALFVGSSLWTGRGKRGRVPE